MRQTLLRCWVNCGKSGQSLNNGISYEEYLKTHNSLTYTNVGTSMLPLLRQGKDLFTIVKKGEARCEVGDVVLYRRPPCHYVLHRIVKVRENDYVILGDNCVNREYGVTDNDILGVMVGYVRNGKAHSANEPLYIFYTCLWTHTAGLRITAKRCIYRIGKWLNKR